MSCGGGKHGNYGLVSYAAAFISAETGDKYPAKRVASLYHNEVPDSIRADMAEGKEYPDPTAEQAIAFLNARLNAVQNDPRIAEERKDTIRRNLEKRISLIEEEVAAGGPVKGEGGTVIPNGTQFEAWKRLLNAARKDYDENACPDCGRWPTASHKCSTGTAAKAATPDVTPQRTAPPLRDLMNIPTRTSDPLVMPTAPSAPSARFSGDQRSSAEPSSVAGTESSALSSILSQVRGLDRCPDCGQFHSTEKAHYCTGMRNPLDAYDASQGDWDRHSAETAQAIYEYAETAPHIAEEYPDETERYGVIAQYSARGLTFNMPMRDADVPEMMAASDEETARFYQQGLDQGMSPRKAARFAVRERFYQTAGIMAAASEERANGSLKAPAPESPASADRAVPTAAQTAAMVEADARREQAEYERQKAEFEAKYGPNPNCPNCGEFYSRAGGHTCPPGTANPQSIAPSPISRSAQPDPAPSSPRTSTASVEEELASYAGRVMADPAGWTAERSAVAADALSRAYDSQSLTDRYPDEYERGAAAAIYAVKSAMAPLPRPADAEDHFNLRVGDFMKDTYEKHSRDGHPPRVAAALAANDFIDRMRVGLLEEAGVGSEYSDHDFANDIPQRPPSRTRKGGTVTGRDFVPLDADLAAAYTGLTYNTADPNSPVSHSGGQSRCRACGQFVAANGQHTCPGPRGARVEPQIAPVAPTAPLTPVSDDELPPRGYVRCANCKTFLPVNKDGSPPAQCVQCAQSPSNTPLPADTDIKNKNAKDPGEDAAEEQTYQKRMSAGKALMIAAAVLLVPWPFLLPFAAVYLVRRLSEKRRIKRKMPERVARGQKAAEQMGAASAPNSTLSEAEEKRKENLAQVFDEAERDMQNSGAMNDEDGTPTEVINASESGDTESSKPSRRTPVTPEKYSMRYRLARRAREVGTDARHRVMAFLSGSSPSDYKPTGSFVDEIKSIRMNRASAKLVEQVRQRHAEFRVRARQLPTTNDQPAVRPTLNTPAGSASIPDLSSLVPPSGAGTSGQPEYASVGR